MALNPLTYSMAAVRHLLPAATDPTALPPFALCLGVSFALSVGLLIAAVLLTRRTGRSFT